MEESSADMAKRFMTPEAIKVEKSTPPKVISPEENLIHEAQLRNERLAQESNERNKELLRKESEGRNIIWGDKVIWGNIKGKIETILKDGGMDSMSAIKSLEKIEEMFIEEFNKDKDKKEKE